MANPMPLTAQLTPFNSETGRLAGLRSAEVHLELLENGKRFKEFVGKLDSEKTAEQAEVQNEVRRQIEVSDEQLERTRARLNSDDCGDKERAGLLRELRGIMEHLCRLRGIGEPGRLRPVNEPARQPRRSAPIEPIAMPTTSSVPTSPAEPEPNG